MEAGLRNLDREIAAICRKLARIHLQAPKNEADIIVDEPLVERLLGPPKYIHEIAQAGQQVGVTTGLVWSEFGGEIISVEASLMEGNQQLILTGSLGTILRESAQTALSYIRSHADELSIQPDFFRKSDIHIHIPAGAVPKDGPSAGLTIVFALISLLTGRPAFRNVALTGELTLSGRILPVGGIREKILAAQRAGVKTVVFPANNEADIKSLEEELHEGVKVVLAREIMPLLDIVLA
jgi:ATP-dependent Lon protease